ncbi:TPA: hypothetical protein ACOEN9_000002 [Stenotrophomonas maltophilia]|uniref:Minor coat protein n=1 Tax=Stenotrophomonas maltophilia TaxID=40324 RepID=A0A246HU25_STEMA|nr:MULTISPECIES: hypothetical protein [Stenotrophomonas maltophilia group]QCZ97252.1 hypothetical protein DL544_10200 [Stenotrophomonas sp. pho]DAG74285.1 MAG TPA: Minor Head Virion Protein G6P [Inoviridae sp.]MBH1718915.1 hypothetical protein [Stenotrophomonas maltophilia]MBH1793220.1 hypothetical protein [Stenotrophomonas maltophilia]MBH1887506.1 hypothetical protein [Stenotrophomonas maltophilia]
MRRNHLIVLAAALIVLVLSASWAYADGVGPVTALTTWAKEQITSLWADFSDFMTDLQTDFIELVLSFVKAIVYLIPAPDFLSQISFCAMLNAAGPWTAFIVAQLRVGEAIAVLTAALVFRLVRVFLTLFQWT